MLDAGHRDPRIVRRYVQSKWCASLYHLGRNTESRWRRPFPVTRSTLPTFLPTLASESERSGNAVSHQLFENHSLAKRAKSARSAWGTRCVQGQGRSPSACAMIEMSAKNRSAASVLAKIVERRTAVSSMLDGPVFGRPLGKNGPRAGSHPICRFSF